MLQLYINNKPADIKEETIFALTKTFESVHNPTLYYADYSKTITLPVSAQNNAIFSNFNRLDSTVTNLSIDPTKKIPAYILNNQEPVLEGYVQLNNANTIYTEEKYEITFYSTLGLIMNIIKQLTFNKNAVDIDPEYVIDSPLSDDLKIDRNLVKQSFQQLTHQLDGNDVTDWIGFIPTYQGKYDDFSSDKEQVLTSGRVDDMTRERDEHYKREFRSYYQQPFIWLDKLWKVAKDKVEEITDYTLNLDGSWFNGSNPYYKDLIYTCPSLFTSDSNFRQSTENFADTRNVVMFNKPSKSPSLSTHNNLFIYNLDSTNNAGIFNENTGVFNEDVTFGSSKVKGRFKATLFASIPGYTTDGYWYCKITDDNPFYVKIKAVNATTGQDIYGANKTFLLYSDDHDCSSGTYDESIDLGICNIANTGVAGGIRPLINHTGFQQGNHAWECNLDFELNITENVPYKLYFEVWNANNGDPFEYTNTFSGITWDWLWGDDFNTSYGANNDKGYSFYFDTENISCETTENLRTNSTVSLYRVFPKDVTICDVLLNYSKMFGLMWDVNDDEKTITVMTRNRFFRDYTILDWTDRIDRSKEFKFSPLCFDKRYVEFNYDEGNCGRLKSYESTYQFTYGSKKLDTGYEFNSDTNELYENLTPAVVSQKRQYSKMMNTEYEDRPNFMGYSYMVYPQEHYVDNDDEGKNAGMSGAFYFRNGTFEPDEKLSNWDFFGRYCVTISDDTQHMIQTQEYCWNSCGEGIALCYKLPDVSTISKEYDGKRFSVHFESPREYYFDTPDGDINYVYNSFWKDYINERYCSQNKKLTAYVYISLNEFKNIDFREFIKIDNILYHIDKIYDYNYNSDEPVKMDLVQVWNLKAYTQGQTEVPYLFTVPQRVGVSTSDTTVDVYTSYQNYHIVDGLTPSWITASIDGNGDLQIRANSNTNDYREGMIYLLSGTASAWDVLRLGNAYPVMVYQHPATPYRLEVDRNTLVFPSTGGTETITIDCHNLSNNAISVLETSSWIDASIAEYSQTSLLQLRRDCLHLNVTCRPTTSTSPRNASITLLVGGDTFYSQTINIGQQGGQNHTRRTEVRPIARFGDDDLIVLDENNNRVTTLISGRTYHFEDLFPEQIDIDSLRITGGGSVNITGNSGLQTVEFIPQILNENQVSGGMITACTMNGDVVTYNYDVQVEGYVPPEPVNNGYFYVEDISGAANTLSITKSSASAPSITIEYSTDGELWQTLGTTSETSLALTIPANSKVYLRANADRWCNASSVNYYNNIDCAGYFNVGGSIMSLLAGSDYEEAQLNNASNNAFCKLFSGDTRLVDASSLKLPNNVTANCYDSMFDTCTNLKNIPVLPATTLAGGCYSGMFRYCSSIYETPELPATTLADGCYNWMFGNCTGLTKAPNLPATTLYEGCYAAMFANCENLQYIPALPATTLAPYCYEGMFDGCRKLNYMQVYANDNSASGCISDWLKDVAPTGDFYNYGSASYVIDDPSGVPLGWTLHTSGTPTPPSTSRYVSVTVANTNQGKFRIETTPSVMQPKVTDYFQEKILDGTVVTLTALPSEGYTIKKWIDQDGNEYNTPVLTFTVQNNPAISDYNIKYTLFFTESSKTFDVIISASDDGYITVGSDPTHYQTYEKTVLEGATIANVKVYPNSGYTFMQWSDGSVSNPRDFTIYADTTVKALYSGGSGTSYITLDGGGLLGANDYISLGLDGVEVGMARMGEYKTISVPNGTYEWKLYCHINDLNNIFSSWDIDGTTITQNPYTNAAMVIGADKVIKVSCIQNVNYNVSVSAGTGGVVSVNGVTGNYNRSVQNGTVLTLAATPNAGYVFSGWSDGNNNNPRNLTVSANTTLTATFTAIPSYTVSISAGNNGSVSVNGVSGDYSGTVLSGTTLTLVATPNTDYQFDEWSDGNTDNPRTITVTGNITLTASFENLMEHTYFYVEDGTGSGSTLYIKGNNNAPTITVYKSTDQVNWVRMGNTSSTPITATVPANSKLYLKATANSWYSNNGNFNNIYYDGSFNIGGNIMSLLYGDNFYGQTTLQYNNTFRKLFYLRTVRDASNLILPATTLSDFCYAEMFFNSSLNIPPQLPATTLTIGCYYAMFASTSLASAPVLPATTLANNCYQLMFYRTSLRIAPELPATTLTSYCYSDMFKECTHLTTTPTTLPATTLAISCYAAMFRGCSNLTTVPEILPATTLKTSCYEYMFFGCYSLTTAPVLPATTLVEGCYKAMFSNSSIAEPAALNKVITYANNISASNCLNYWLDNVSATGDFYNLGSATYPSGASGIPTGWTEHTSI